MNKHLFIGGPADGKWIEAEGPVWRVPEEPRRFAWLADEQPEFRATKTFDYHALRFAADVGTWTIYAYQLTADQVSKRLITNYTPTAQ